MSLLRTALRMAAVATLRADPAVSALCADRIYDSRISNFSASEAVPVLTLTTEEDEGEAWSANNGGGPFNNTCDLVIEVAIYAVAPDPEGGESLAAPVTDAEMEVSLDLIEHAAVFALTEAQTSEARLLRKAVTRRVTKAKSYRFATDQPGVKLAVRLLTLKVELKGDGQLDARNPPTGPFAGLPGPLRMVCEAMPADSYDGRVCRMIAAHLPPPAPPRTLKGADFKPPSSPQPGAPAGVVASITFPGST